MKHPPDEFATQGDQTSNSPAARLVVHFLMMQTATVSTLQRRHRHVTLHATHHFTSPLSTSVWQLMIVGSVTA